MVRRMPDGVGYYAQILATVMPAGYFAQISAG